MKLTLAAIFSVPGVLGATLLLILIPGPAAAQTCSARCPDGSTSRIYDCDNPPSDICGSGRSSGAGPNNFWIIEQQRRAAEEALKQKQLEEEEQRRQELQKEARRQEERLRQEKIERNAKFLRDRNATVLKGTFGSNVVRLKDLTSPDPPEPKGSIADNAGLLKSVDYHSSAALELDDERGKREAGKGFDEPGANKGTLVYPARRGRMPDFVSSIPRELVQNYADIRNSLTRYQQIDKQKQQTGDKIARIKELQKKGDRSVALATQLTALKNQMKRFSADQVKTEKRIKKRVVDLSFTLDEPAKSSKSDQPDKERK